MDPDPPKERAELVALCSLPGVTARRISEMLTIFGSPTAAWEAIRSGATRPPAGRPESPQSGWQEIARSLHPRRRLAAMERDGISTVVRGEAGYPPLLTETHGARWALFYRGRLPGPQEVCVAIVGARKATPYGRAAARWLAAELAVRAVTVVSGAAYGIGHATHVGALDAGGGTVAVLGCGVDVVYPRSSEAVLRRTAETGCIISEYPPGTQPAKYRFPERNRIIAGMSRAVVVVEAASDSGALLTADCAMEEGRDVMAIPRPGLLFQQQGHERPDKGRRSYSDRPGGCPPGDRPGAGRTCRTSSLGRVHNNCFSRRDEACTGACQRPQRGRGALTGDRGWRGRDAIAACPA